MLKGAGAALLARLATARHSKDVDMFFDATSADVGEAVDASRAALRIDLGDHFGFDITRVSPPQEEAKGARVHVSARLGPTSSATFHMDVVAPLTPLDIEGLIRPHNRVFPVPDHLADKLAIVLDGLAPNPAYPLVESLTPPSRGSSDGHGPSRQTRAANR